MFTFPRLTTPRLTQAQRAEHRGAAQALIAQLESQLAGPCRRSGAVERVSSCKEQLASNPGDGELLRISAELSHLFYRANNALKRRGAPS